MKIKENLRQLPVLDKTMNLLRPDKQKKEALQSLVINNQLLDNGKTVWIDSCNYASTHTMHRLTPDPKLLERIEVARAFTPYQHYSLTENLIEKIDQNTSLIVLPAFDYLYNDDNQLYSGESKKMLGSAIEYIEDVSDQYNISVLMTDTGNYRDIIRDCMDEIITCSVTSMGARFQCSDFETLVYPDNGGLQTTLELWRRILEKTYESVSVEQTKSSEVGVYG